MRWSSPGDRSDDGPEHKSNQRSNGSDYCRSDDCGHARSDVRAVGNERRAGRYDGSTCGQWTGPDDEEP